MTIWKKIIDPKSVFIIAEAEVNHNNSLQMAYKLVDVAVEAGAQIYTNKRLKDSGYLSFTERYTQVTNF